MVAGLTNLVRNLLTSPQTDEEKSEAIVEENLEGGKKQQRSGSAIATKSRGIRWVLSREGMRPRNAISQDSSQSRELVITQTALPCRPVFCAKESTSRAVSHPHEVLIFS